MLWDAAMQETGVGRAVWAERLRAPVRNHPRAWALVTSPARKKCLSANRRAAKTESCGREAAARCIERDGYVVWVFAGDLSEYSRNWLERKPRGLLHYLVEAGMVEGVHFRVHRAATHIREITFPRWGSTIRCYSAKDYHQVSKARGGKLSLLLVDEAQKMPLLMTLLLEVVSDAAADMRAEIWIAGTPGEDISSMFGRIATGAIRGWECARFWSWDNPFFGSTWRERYERHVLYTTREFRDEYGVTEEQMAFLEAMTEDLARDIMRDERAQDINPLVLREKFGVWLEAGEVHVFSAIHAVEPFWEDAPAVVTRAHRGEATFEDFMSEAREFEARIARLPTHSTWAHPRPKYWQALLGVDFGFVDPFALALLAYSDEDPGMYELASCKGSYIPEDLQATIVEHWVAETEKRKVKMRGVIADAPGGASRSTAETWSYKLNERFGVAVYPALKADMRVEQQAWLMNSDMRRGTVKLRRNSPLATEMEHLRWKVERGRRVPDDKRVVYLADGSEAVPGDHCADGARYAWYWSRHGDKKPITEPLEPGSPEAIEADIMKANVRHLETVQRERRRQIQRRMRKRKRR